MEENSLPRVSVIMPIRNEADFVRRSLGAVIKQDYPPELLDVLVVDGMSDDGTREAIQKLLEDCTGDESVSAISPDTIHFGVPKVQVLDNPFHFVPFAMNAGLANAQGDVVILVGGHCEIAQDYVRRCVQALRESNADCVGGVMATVGQTDAAQAIALAQSSFFGVGGVAFRTGRSKAGYVDTVAFGAYRFEIFKRIGDFDEELIRNQDDEFNYRISQAGGRIWLDPSIQSTYYSRASLGRLWRQYFQYGYWKVRVMQKHPGQMCLRHFAPPAFALTLLVSVLLSPLSNLIFYLCLAVSALYLFANLAATLWVAHKGGRQYLPLLPVAFITLHMSYGLGFLLGLIKFWKRWGERPVNPGSQPISE